MEIKRLSIKEDFIRLDSAMKLAGIVSTGGHAKTCLMRGKKLKSGDTAEFDGFKFVIE